MDDVDALHEEYRRSGTIIRLEYALGDEGDECGRTGRASSSDGQ